MKLPNGDDVCGKFVLADASHCPTHKAVGYAGAVVYDDGRVFYMCGIGYSGSSNSAEGYALAKAFEWALAEGLIVQGDTVTLATDNHHCYMRMSGRRMSKRNRSRIARGLPLPKQDTGNDFGSPRKIIGTLAAQHSLVIDVIQIPGHTSEEVRRRSLIARVMGELDRRSRQKMKELRMEAWKAILKPLACQT